MRLLPFAVERWFNQYEFRVRYNIAESCARPLRVAELLALAGQGEAGGAMPGDGAGVDGTTMLAGAPDLGSLRLGYIESDGRPDLRELVAGLYPGATADDVLITVGAIEANFLALSHLCGPGDRVIAAVPTYQQLWEVPRAQGAQVDFWPLRPELGWRPDLDELRQMLRTRTRVVIVNFPNNPTGASLDRSFLAELAALCREHGALLYSDEVYRGLPLTADEGQPSAWELAPGESVVVGSLSKAYGLPGLRVGWLVAPPEVRTGAHVIRDYTSICSPALSEELAALALRARPAILAAQRAHARRNLALVEALLAQTQGRLSWTPPQEGVIGLVRFAARMGSREFARRLAEEHDTLVVPGECFGIEGHFRIGFGYETEKLEQGLERLGRFVASL